MVGLGHAASRVHPVDDADLVGRDQNIAGVKVTVAQAVPAASSSRSRDANPPQPRWQAGVLDADGQDLAEIGKIRRRLDPVKWQRERRPRASHDQHATRPPLEQRQHVRPVNALQHQARTTLVVHDIDQSGADTVTIQSRQCRRLGPMPQPRRRRPHLPFRERAAQAAIRQHQYQPTAADRNRRHVSNLDAAFAATAS